MYTSVSTYQKSSHFFKKSVRENGKTNFEILPNDYRFGFNGMEKDNELKGVGNSLDFGARMYDSRLGRFLSLDPIKRMYPWNSPYAFAENSPIAFLDEEGLGKLYFGNGLAQSGMKLVLDILKGTEVANDLLNLIYSHANKYDVYLVSRSMPGSNGSTLDPRIDPNYSTMFNSFSQSTANGHIPVLIKLSEENFNALNKAIISFNYKTAEALAKQIALTIIHELDAHYGDYVSSGNANSAYKDHTYFYGEAVNRALNPNSTGDQISPPYEDVKINSFPAGRAKNEIEKSVRNMKEKTFDASKIKDKSGKFKNDGDKKKFEIKLNLGFNKQKGGRQGCPRF